MDRKYFEEDIDEFLAEKQIQDLKELTKSDLVDIAERFFGLFEAHGHLFLGLDSFLQYKYGCLLEKWFNEAKNHEGKKVNEVPELVSLSKDIDDFRAFTKKFLGFDYSKGTFEEI